MWGVVAAVVVFLCACRVSVFVCVCVCVRVCSLRTRSFVFSVFVHSACCILAPWAFLVYVVSPQRLDRFSGNGRHLYSCKVINVSKVQDLARSIWHCFKEITGMLFRNSSAPASFVEPEME